MMIPLSLSLSLYIYIYIYVCVCVCMYIYMCMYTHLCLYTCTYTVYRLSPEFKQDFSYETTYTLNTHLSRWFDIQTRQEKRKSENNWPPQNNILVIFSVSLFFAETLWWQLLPSCLQLLEHLAVWLEGQFELSNNFYVPIHWRAWVIRFWSWEDPTNLRDLGTRTRVKRGTGVLYNSFQRCGLKSWSISAIKAKNFPSSLPLLLFPPSLPPSFTPSLPFSFLPSFPLSF